MNKLTLLAIAAGRVARTSLLVRVLSAKNMILLTRGQLDELSAPPNSSKNDPDTNRHQRSHVSKKPLMCRIASHVQNVLNPCPWPAYS